jgi:ligand-binding SRPBCC domain-containing protein
MPTHLEFADWVPYPLPHVFAFFSNPENLPRIMPPASATKLIRLDRQPPPPAPAGASAEKAAGTGSTIVTTFRLFPFLPIRAEWISRITEFEWDHHFADVQDKGPFKSWHHRHEFVGEIRNGVTGTLVRDAIEYEVGFGILGRMADAVFVRRTMQHTFAQRQQKLPELLSQYPPKIETGRPRSEV